MFRWILINTIGIGISLGYITTEGNISGFIDLFIASLISGVLFAGFQSFVLQSYPVINWGWAIAMGWVFGLMVGAFFGGGWCLWTILGISLGAAQGSSIEDTYWFKRWILINTIIFLIVIFVGGFMSGIIGFFTGKFSSFIAMFIAGGLYGVVTGGFLEWIRLGSEGFSAKIQSSQKF